MNGKKQNNGKHICKYCKAGFSTEPNLIYHLSVCPVGSDKRTKKYACEWCKQEFSSEPLLQYHRTSCHCKVKNKFYEGFKFKFPFASLDSMHEENLVDVDDVEVRNDPTNMDNDPPQYLPILCKWCGRDFMSEEQYKKHHPGCPNKPCPEEESEDEELVDPVDMMQEEDSEVFRCLWCFGTFGTAAHLKLHRNICPKRRFRDSSFNKKALTDDTNQENVKEPPVTTSEYPKKIYTCEWCGKVWKKLIPFLVHPVMCPMKPKVEEASNEAKKEHPIPRPKTPPGMFKCEWCGRIFEDWHKLQWHRNDCPDNPDKKKGLQDNNHDPIPRPKTPPNTYRCDWCQRVFSSEYHLNWHRQRCPKKPKTPPKKVTEKKISPGTEYCKAKKRKRDISERRPDYSLLSDDFLSFEEEFFSCPEDEEGFENRTDLQNQFESDVEATQINNEANIEETRSDSEAYIPATPSDSLNGKLVSLRPNSSTKTNCSASPIVKRFKCRISGVMLEDQVQFGFSILEAHFDFRYGNQIDFENPDSSAATDTKIVELELDYKENGSEGQYTCAKSDENHPSVLVTSGQLVLNHSNGYETYQCEWCGHYFSSKDHLEWHKKRCPKKPPESVNEDMTKQSVTPKTYDSGQVGTPCRKRKSVGSDVASAKKLRFVDFDEKSVPSCEESKEDDVEMPEDVLNRSHVEAKANDSPSNQKSEIEPKDPPKEVETPYTEFLVVKCKTCNKHFEAPKPKLRLKDFMISHNREKHGIENSFDGFLIKISSILNPIKRDKEVKEDDGTQGTTGPIDEELDVEFDFEKIGNHEWYKCKKCDKKYRSVLKITRHHRLTHGSPQGFESDKSKSVLQKFQDFDENVRKHPQTRKGGGGRPKQNRNPKSPKKQKEESIKPQTFRCEPCNTMFYTQREKDVHLRTAEHREKVERLAEQGKK